MLALARWAAAIVAVAAVSGDRRQNPDPGAGEHRGHVPHLAGDVVLADEVDVEGCRHRRFPGADDVVEQGVGRRAGCRSSWSRRRPGACTGTTGRPIAWAAAAHTASRSSPVIAGTQVSVDEHRRWPQPLGRLQHGVVELAFAAEDDVVLRQVAGDPASVQLAARWRRCPALPRSCRDSRSGRGRRAPRRRSAPG